MYEIKTFLETLSWLGFIAAICLSFYFYLRFRHKERMALIEKGVDVSEIFKSRDLSFKFPWFRLGMLAIGIGLGFCFAYFILVVAPPEYTKGDSEMILIFSVLIFGGLGVIIGHILERSGKKKNG